jgi:pyruvate dehydrogenase E1 component alpha subunit
MEEAVARARNGEGPTFLEMRTYRYRGHSMSDPAKYRTKEEVEAYKLQDPLEKVRQTLLDQGWYTESELEAWEERIMKVVLESVEFAENSPYPDESELYTDVYTDSYPFIME